MLEPSFHAKKWTILRKICRAVPIVQFYFLAKEAEMNSSSRLLLANRCSGGSPANIIEQVVFKFQDLEIRWNTLVLHFLDEKTIIPLNDIESYSLKWYLHDPTLAKKYWF
jgi:hypothetical protein